MTHSVKSPLPSVVTCPYCNAKLFWIPPIEEGLVARQNCPRCKSSILIIDNVAHFDASAKKAPQKAVIK
jgi:DNA-directed RNA polymerase subunit RPC12/RpoP